MGFFGKAFDLIPGIAPPPPVPSLNPSTEVKNIGSWASQSLKAAEGVPPSTVDKNIEGNAMSPITDAKSLLGG